MQSDMPELTTWRFVSSPDEAGNQAKMEMGLNAVTSRGTLVWPEFYALYKRSLYCLCANTDYGIFQKHIPPQPDI
jgi:hypothetical protein